MLPITCIRCHRPYLSAAKPRPGVRCPICRGRLEVADAAARELSLTPLPIEFPPVTRAERGSYHDTEHAFSSLIDFVNDDPRRGPSRERDVGLGWRGAGKRTYRAAWIQDTGELYLVQTGDAAVGGGHVEILGHAADTATLLRVLDGWDEQCGAPYSVEWLRTRAADRLEPPVRRIDTGGTLRELARGLSGGSKAGPRVPSQPVRSIG